MRSLTDKLLTLILALLMGLSPLQGAVASITASSFNDVGIHQAMGHEHAMSTESPCQLEQDCPQHLADNGCTTHVGSFSHCTSCVMGILPVTPSLFTPLLKSSSRPSSVGFSSQYTTSLYRPPRA